MNTAQHISQQDLLTVAVTSSTKLGVATKLKPLCLNTTGELKRDEQVGWILLSRKDVKGILTAK